MLTLDGSRGEGGGQIVRTSLALSVITGTPFRMVHVRAGREKPGLRPQHVACVRAAAQIGGADTTGAERGSTGFAFTPSTVTPGKYTFSIGTAGSASLVLQTVLPPLLTAGGPSTLTLSGGTHNAWAPPFDFLEKTFLPLINRMGPRVTATLERPCFYPAGGGLFRVEIRPADRLEPIELTGRRAVRELRARALVSRLPAEIGRRELDALARELDLASTRIEEIRNGRGPGNAVMVEVESKTVTEVFTGVGKKGVRAEKVARGVAAEVKEYLKRDAPVGPHLADQLMIPMALARGGAIRTGPLTRHATTNIETIGAFLPVRLKADNRPDSTVIVSI